VVSPCHERLWVYLDNIEVRTVNFNRYLLLLFKVYLYTFEVRTVNVNIYLLLLFKVYLDNIEVRIEVLTDICYYYLRYI
jgi:hypothetical protein